MKKGALVFLSGFLFGAGLALSGMTDPKRVIDFLDLAGDWDPTLAFVMAGALLVFGMGYFFLKQKLGLPGNPEEPVSRSLIVGSILFGVGWGLGGFCPGPAIANLGAIRMEALVFVPTMALGMVIAQWLQRSRKEG